MYSDMTEIETKVAELERQKAELTRQIRELRDDGRLTVGDVRIARRTMYSDEWSLAISVPTHRRDTVKQYKTLFYGSRNECIERIRLIVDEFEELYNAAKGEKKT